MKSLGKGKRQRLAVAVKERQAGRERTLGGQAVRGLVAAGLVAERLALVLGVYLGVELGPGGVLLVVLEQQLARLLVQRRLRVGHDEQALDRL